MIATADELDEYKNAYDQQKAWYDDSIQNTNNLENKIERLEEQLKT